MFVSVRCVCSSVCVFIGMRIAYSLLRMLAGVGMCGYVWVCVGMCGYVCVASVRVGWVWVSVCVMRVSASECE